MKISLRALFYLLSVMVVLVALVSLPVAAQEAPPAAPSVAAAASSSSTPPAAYNPAAAAFATPKSAPAAASSEGPDPDRRWEVEIHGGYQFAINPTSGTSNLPNPGAPFSTFLGVNDSRAISSWYFGNGALLYNQSVAATVLPFQLLNTITPWDPVLTSSVVRRQDGGTVGGRVSYDFNRRFNAEINFDYNMGDLAFTSGALINTLATSDSFVAAFSERLDPTGFCGGLCTNTVVTSTPTLINHQGAAFEFTGGVNVNLWTSGRFIPYASVGVGVLHTTGDVPAINLTGNYQFSIGAQNFNETDSATLVTSVQGNTFVGYVGVGAKYYVTPHWGFRFDVRDHISANGISNLLSASPSLVLVAPGTGTCLTQVAGPPRVEFCNQPAGVFGQSSLSGPAVSNFHSFSGSGALHQVSVTGGLFFRF
ncbi:MAG TPA: hypothetical protein VEG08_06550 [Terriglobales bacterium]|nr:hypothetical protein [Terriglobales bacterium]